MGEPRERDTRMQRRANGAQMQRRAKGAQMQRFDAIYNRSLKEPESFWAEIAEGIQWDRPWDLVLDDRNPPFYRWFSGGRLNTCYNALDLHVETGRGEQPALIYDSPVTSTLETFTYRQLRDDTALFAGVLAAHGVSRGDRVVIYMPMVPQTVVAMLACAHLGAVHSVVFGGFAANELAIRIDDAIPKLIVSASCGIEPNRIVEYKPLLDQAIGLAHHKPDRCIILQREQHRCQLDPTRDLDWVSAMESARPHDCVSVAATDPLYILYTSGTTAHPDVAECAVIGAADPLKGQLPVGFLVLNAGVDRDGSEIVGEVIQQVRERIGPVAAFKNAVVVDRLPKTRSGKVLRGTMRKLADGEAYSMPATIEEPAVLDEIGEALGTLGYPRRG